jgi:plastocyanin
LFDWGGRKHPPQSNQTAINHKNGGHMIRLVLPIVALAGAVFVGTAAPGQAATTLRATVGPGSTITLKTSAGRAVKNLSAGSYVIVVRDRSKRHDFHLIGPTNALNRATTVRFVGTQTWRLTLTKGAYRFVCDAHARTMKGTFRVS